MQHPASPLRGSDRHAQRGSVVVYLILALAAFGVLAASGATRFGAAVQGAFRPNCATQARYMSESGVRYALARLRACADEAAVAAAVGDMNGRKYTVDAARGLAYTLTVSYATGTATVTSAGASCGNTGSAPSGFTGSTVANLPALGSGPSAGDNPVLQGTYSGLSALIAGNSVGNVTTVSTTLQGGSTVSGSLTYLGTSTCLDLNGGVSVGVLGGDDYVCSNTCVTIRGGSLINGDVLAQGDVTVSSGVVSGDVYAKGAVTVTSGTVRGSIYAQGGVTVTGLVLGSIYSGGNVSLGWGATVLGNIHCSGSFTVPPSYYGYTGHVTTGYAKSSIPSPPACTSYTLPAHKTVPSTQARVISGDHTFFGVNDLADTSNAFTSISTTGWPRICLDLSQPGSYINIFCSGDVSIRGELYVRTSTATTCFNAANRMNSTLFSGYAAASRVYMDVKGSVTFGGGVPWFGTVYAGGNIYPGGGGSYIGAFYTNQSFNPDSQWISSRYVGSDYVAAYWP